MPNTWAGGSHPGTLSQALQQGGRRDGRSSQGQLPVLRRMRSNVTEYLREEMCRVDGTDEDQALWLPTVTEAIYLRVALEEQMLDIVAHHDQEQQEFLVTRTVGNQEVWNHLHDWELSIRAEHQQLVHQKKAVRQMSRKAMQEQELAKEKGVPIEFLPAKIVHTRKAPSGAYRSRAVICGNYAQDDDSVCKYAGGADAVQVGAVIRAAAMEEWSLAATDIRVAFLNAPKRRDESKLTCCEIPAVFRRLVLADDDHVWVVDEALYGLTTSPRDWSLRRDSTVPKIKWRRQTADAEWTGCFVLSGDENLCRLIETNLVTGEEVWRGLMTVYVDDLLVAACPEVIDAAMASLSETWAISEVEYASDVKALRFCGFEVRADETGDGFHLAQTMYEQELMTRWGVTEKTSYPIFKVTEADDGEHVFSREDLRTAQALTGALLWLSTRTRPDLVHGVSVMSRMVSKNPCKAVEIGYALLKYVNGNPSDMHYPREVPHGAWGARNHLKVARHRRTLEVFSDIAYAAGSNFRSVQGILVYYGGVPIAWQCSQQPFVTHSTAESELVSLCEGLLAGRATEALLCLLNGEEVGRNSLERVIYGDNMTAIGMAEGSTAASWRTRHLRIRANVLKEAVSQELVEQVGHGNFYILVGRSLWRMGAPSL